MKKTLLTLALTVLAAVGAFASDMTTVWETVAQDTTFIVAPVASDKAAENGFETLSIALNSAPTSRDIDNVKRLAATIDSNQQVTSVSQQGVDVAVYAAPASADGSTYKLMLVIDKNDNADKALMILYGICTRQGIARALQNLSIEDLIGG